VPHLYVLSENMKTLIIALLLISINLVAAQQSWEIVRSKAEQVSDERVKITVSVKNVGKEAQIIPASLYDGQDGLALPNSYLWPQDATRQEAMRARVSHYYTHNSRSCHGISKTLTVPINGEVSFIMYDVGSSVGKRLLLVFGDGTSPNIIGALTVPNPKRRESGR
jgi:hypothetical protein